MNTIRFEDMAWMKQRELFCYSVIKKSFLPKIELTISCVLSNGHKIQCDSSRELRYILDAIDRKMLIKV